MTSDPIIHSTLIDMKRLIFLALLMNVALAQSNFYLGQIDPGHRASAQADALEPGTAADVLDAFAAQVMLFLDEQALSSWPSAEATPRPGLLLFSLTDQPSEGLNQYPDRFERGSWFLATGQWLDRAGAWPPLLAGTTGAPLQQQAEQALDWPDLSGIETALDEAAAAPLMPTVAEPSELSDPLQLREIQVAAPAGSTHVMVLTVASPGEGGYRYEHRPVMLVFF